MLFQASNTPLLSNLQCALILLVIILLVTGLLCLGAVRSNSGNSEDTDYRNPNNKE